MGNRGTAPRQNENIGFPRDTALSRSGEIYKSGERFDKVYNSVEENYKQSWRHVL